MERAQAGIAATGLDSCDVLQASCLSVTCCPCPSLPGCELHAPVACCWHGVAYLSPLHLP